MNIETLIRPDASRHITPQTPLAASYVEEDGAAVSLTAVAIGTRGNTLSVEVIEDDNAETLSIQVVNRTIVDTVVVIIGDPTTHFIQAALDLLNDTPAAAALITADYDDQAPDTLITAATYQLAGGRNGIILTKGECVFDEDFVYLAAEHTTATDSTGLRKIALLPFIE